MNQQHVAPVIRLVTDPATAAAGEPETVADAVAAVPMSRRERTGNAARRRASAAVKASRELWAPAGRMLYRLMHPESFTEHRAYVKSRAWVPDGMTSWPRNAFVIAGIAYHLVIARPLKAAAKAVDSSADRPLRFLCLIVFLLVLIHVT